MIDAVLSYHMNTFGCGVAKFNHALARRLGVPCRQMFHPSDAQHPLVSIKAAELGARWMAYLPVALHTLLLHDRPAHVPTGVRILYADEVGCPSTIEGNPTRGAYRVLTFGMAHKRVWRHYQALKAQLDAEHPDYTIELSTAIHEGHPWDSGLAQCIGEMRAIFGDKLRVLGFLGDDALAKELHDCDAIALFFEPAWRANNTTVWAAVDAGKTLYVNSDAQSPEFSAPHDWDTLIATLNQVPVCVNS